MACLRRLEVHLCYALYQGAASRDLRLHGHAAGLALRCAVLCAAALRAGSLSASRCSTRRSALRADRSALHLHGRGTVARNRLHHAHASRCTLRRTALWAAAAAHCVSALAATSADHRVVGIGRSKSATCTLGAGSLGTGSLAACRWRIGVPLLTVFVEVSGSLEVLVATELVWLEPHLVFCLDDGVPLWVVAVQPRRSIRFSPPRSNDLLTQHACSLLANQDSVDECKAQLARSRPRRRMDALHLLRRELPLAYVQPPERAPFEQFAERRDDQLGGLACAHSTVVLLVPSCVQQLDRPTVMLGQILQPSLDQQHVRHLLGSYLGADLIAHDFVEHHVPSAVLSLRDISLDCVAHFYNCCVVAGLGGTASEVPRRSTLCVARLHIHATKRTLQRAALWAAAAAHCVSVLAATRADLRAVGIGRSKSATRAVGAGSLSALHARLGLHRLTGHTQHEGLEA